MKVKLIKPKILLLIILSLGLHAQQQPPKTAPIDVNSATQQQLETLPGIGPTRAKMIIRMRATSGPFKTVDELRAIPRLSDKQFEQLRQYVTLGPSVENRRSQPLPKR